MERIVPKAALAVKLSSFVPTAPHDDESSCFSWAKFQRIPSSRVENCIHSALLRQNKNADREEVEHCGLDQEDWIDLPRSSLSTKEFHRLLSISHENIDTTTLLKSSKTPQPFSNMKSLACGEEDVHEHDPVPVIDSQINKDEGAYSHPPLDTLKPYNLSYLGESVVSTVVVWSGVPLLISERTYSWNISDIISHVNEESNSSSTKEYCPDTDKLEIRGVGSNSDSIIDTFEIKVFNSSSFVTFSYDSSSCLRASVSLTGNERDSALKHGSSFPALVRGELRYGPVVSSWEPLPPSRHSSPLSSSSLLSSSDVVPLSVDIIIPRLHSERRLSSHDSKVSLTLRFISIPKFDGHSLLSVIPQASISGSQSDLFSSPAQLPVNRMFMQLLFVDPDLGGIGEVVCVSHQIRYRIHGSMAEIESVIPFGADNRTPLVVLIVPKNVTYVWKARDIHQIWDRCTSSDIELKVDENNFQKVVPQVRVEQQNPAIVTADSLPTHIAIVMDGNGRWAKNRGLSRSAGHRAGVETIRLVIRSCRRLRIPFLTLFAFSSQNWGRPSDEVSALMTLLGEFTSTDLEELCANGIRLQLMGDIKKLPQHLANGLDRLVSSSAHNTDLTLTLALSYGGREEILEGVRRACEKAASSGFSDINEDDFRGFLPNPGTPDPDLLIRTSGELRVSNFMLWHIAYTELFVTKVLWPDFTEAHLAEALAAFSKRERRFGGVTAVKAPVKEEPWSSLEIRHRGAFIRGTGKIQLQVPSLRAQLIIISLFVTIIMCFLYYRTIDVSNGSKESCSDQNDL